MSDWKSNLVQYFKKGLKKGNSSLLGVEVEHFILNRDTLEAVPYSGSKGIREILSRLMALYPDAEMLPEDDFLGFSLPEFTITLEPAAQFEISIAPMASIRQTGEIYLDFYQKLGSVLEELGYIAVNEGCQPVSRVSDLKMIPKRRYDLMDTYFRRFGTGGMEMMRGSASLQVSIDYQSEPDFRDKIQAAYYYSPVLKLLCDNSSVFQGKKLDTYLKRTDIWRRVDPARCGILPGIFSGQYGFDDYARHLGSVPPIFLKQDKQVIPTGEKTADELFSGRELDDTEITHLLSMVFPDVRLKNFLELRFADSVPFPFVLAYCALIKGLLYSKEGLAYAKKQISDRRLSEEDILLAENELMESGWKASVYGQPVREMAETILALARRNLSEEEQIYLNAFDAVVNYSGIRGIPGEKYAGLCEEIAI